MNHKIVNISLLTIILCLILMMINGNKEQTSEQYLRNNHFLVNFDNQDFKRLEEMVTRFKEGKGDNLMIIPPIVDGGYWIHDVISDGRKVYWTVDNTRDGMSTDKGKIEYICNEIDIRESKERYIFELSNCNHFKEDEKLSMVTFFKEEL